MYTPNFDKPLPKFFDFKFCVLRIQLNKLIFPYIIFGKHKSFKERTSITPNIHWLIWNNSILLHTLLQVSESEKVMMNYNVNNYTINNPYDPRIVLTKKLNSTADIGTIVATPRSVRGKFVLIVRRK
jgi:hypothetical protein